MQKMPMGQPVCCTILAPIRVMNVFVQMAPSTIQTSDLNRVMVQPISAAVAVHRDLDEDENDLECQVCY